MNAKLSAIFPHRQFIVIGMIHLRPLPGSPRYQGNPGSVVEAALRDAQALADGGVDGLMIENFGDIPFFPDRVPAVTVAHLAATALAVRQRVPLPMGVNCLRNDGRAALAVAHAVGAEFIRVNVLCGARLTDQGLLSGIAHDLLRDRAGLGSNIGVFADVDVKHSAPLAIRPLEDEVDDILHRGMADALIVSGTATGKSADPTKVALVKQRAREAPVLVGSGVTVENVDQIRDICDGVIVGTHFKKDGLVEAEVETQRVRAFLSRVR
ncbi:MAG: BtpA/SgcQ family protein [Phycisphaerae bacterium]|nr:BtpA/SgcQ family protein [Phycisphaerae bacterium]MDW8261959.1 BtpA/SgcQ family protein [Phycisphaerales bacterium]